MRHASMLVIPVLALWGCGGDDATVPGDDAGATADAPAAIDAPTAGGEPPGLEGLVAAHNAARAAVGVGPLTWDPALAAIADAWVRQCVDQQAPTGLVDHNANRSSGYPTYVGENIYGSSGTASGTAAVASWVGEQQNYHHDTNTCDSGRVCGHYTQVVWRATTKVGCALYRCPGLQFGSTVVCDYGPGGNISGQSPY
ncbi:MAG: CAP domain-containing protein [Kofleriaceae bacterium]